MGGSRGVRNLLKCVRIQGVYGPNTKCETPLPPTRGAYIELLPGGLIVGYAPRVMFCHVSQCYVALRV